MSIIGVFFSFSGRISRLPFLAASLSLGLVMIGSLLAVFRDLLVSGNQPMSFGDVFEIEWSWVLIIVVGAWWSHLALVFKRSRDMSNSTTFAWIYVGLSVAGFFPFVGVVTGIPLMVLQLVLWFKPSESPRVNPGPPSNRATASASQPASRLDQLSSKDLLARSAQLRQQDQEVTPKRAPTSARPDRSGKPAPMFGKARPRPQRA